METTEVMGVKNAAAGVKNQGRPPATAERSEVDGRSKSATREEKEEAPRAGPDAAEAQQQGEVVSAGEMFLLEFLAMLRWWRREAGKGLRAALKPQEKVTRTWRRSRNADDEESAHEVDTSEPAPDVKIEETSARDLSSMSKILEAAGKIVNACSVLVKELPMGKNGNGRWCFEI